MLTRDKIKQRNAQLQNTSPSLCVTDCSMRIDSRQFGMHIYYRTLSDTR